MWHLPSWKDIIFTKGYHGELTYSQIEHKLQTQPQGTYILTDTEDGKDGTVTMTIKWKREKIKQVNFEKGISTNFQHCHCYCGETANLNPAIRTETPTLKELCRATICKDNKFKDITRMLQDGDIPKEIFTYLTKHKTRKKVISNISVIGGLKCTDYPDCLNKLTLYMFH